MDHTTIRSTLVQCPSRVGSQDDIRGRTHLCGVAVSPVSPHHHSRALHGGVHSGLTCSACWRTQTHRTPNFKMSEVDLPFPESLRDTSAQGKSSYTESIGER